MKYICAFNQIKNNRIKGNACNPLKSQYRLRSDTRDTPRMYETARLREKTRER